MVMGLTTNFPGGATNAPLDSLMGAYLNLDPSLVHEFMDDFDRVDVGTTGTDWLATKVGTTPAVTTASEEYGALLITNSAGASDSCFLQWMGKNAGTVAETWCPEAGRRFWFKTRFKTSDVLLSSIVVGLQVTDTTPLAVSDGCYFLKSAGAATVSFITALNSVLTTTSAVATLVNNTYTTLGFYWDGVDRFNVFVNDVKVAAQGITTLPTHKLALSFGIQNGEAVAKTMTMDYIFAAEERSYP
jgi:hypothetical protein